MYPHLKLSRREVTQSIKKGRLVTLHHWLDDVGVLMLLLGPGVLGSLLLGNGPGAPLAWQTLAGLLLVAAGLVIGLRYLWRKRYLTSVTTGLRAAANRQVVLATFRQLGWPTHQRTARVVTARVPAAGPYTMAHEVVAIVANGRILLNIMHCNNLHRGRLPFSFGHEARKMAELRAQLARNCPPPATT